MSVAVPGDNTLTRQLWHIAGSGDLQQLDQLLSQGADVNAGDRTGVTALMRAAYHGQLAMVRALIFYGANPNARDRSGLTALMMAEYGGHEEIVELLEPFGAQGKTEVPTEPRLVASVTEEDVDVATEYNDSTSGETSHTARPLHEPPEIWEMVHTTQTDSYSPSINSRRVFSLRMFALGVAAIIICTGSVFGFLALRDTLSATDDTPQQPAEASTSQSLTKAPGEISRSSNEPAKLKPVGEMDQRVDPPTVARSVAPAKKASVTQRPKATKVSATVPKQNKIVRRPAKLESEPDTSAKSAKKEAAPASDPVKPSTTQKPKVIQWP